jgi:hypothetical protein
MGKPHKGIRPVEGKTGYHLNKNQYPENIVCEFLNRVVLDVQRMVVTQKEIVFKDTGEALNIIYANNFFSALNAQCVVNVEYPREDENVHKDEVDKPCRVHGSPAEEAGKANGKTAYDKENNGKRHEPMNNSFRSVMP